MDIFQRSIHSNVKQIDPDRLLVTSQMLDLEHSLHMEMVVRISDGEIESAKAGMSKTPFARCKAGAAGMERLAGMRLTRGVIARVRAELGGPRGCSHLVELVCDAIRLIAMLRIGVDVRYAEIDKRTKTEDEMIDEMRGVLRNSCLVFADPEGGEK